MAAPINYDSKYTPADVIALFDFIAPAWKKSSKDAGVDSAKLYKTLENVYIGWTKAEGENGLDKDLQALFAAATATKWFTPAQLEKIDEWLNEVASATADDSDWIENFDDTEDLEKMAYENLECREAVATVDKVGKTVTIEYKGGDYGKGKHNGKVVLNDDGLQLYNDAKPGEYLYWDGDLPEKISHIGECIWEPYWSRHWDGDENEGW